MVKVTTKTEYIAIASESKIVNAWYGDRVIKKGTERKLNKSQAEKAKSAGNAMFLLAMKFMLVIIEYHVESLSVLLRLLLKW